MENRRMLDIGSIIRFVRRKAGITLEECERVTGISRSRLSRIERGEGDVRDDEIPLLEKVLGEELPRPKPVGHDSSAGFWVPFLGTHPRITPRECVAQFGRYPVPPALYGEDRYAFVVKDNEMSPVLRAGDVVLIEWRDAFDKKNIAQQDKVCVVWDSQVARMWWVAMTDGGITLLGGLGYGYNCIGLNPNMKIMGVVLVILQRVVSPTEVDKEFREFQENMGKGVDTTG